MTNKETDFNMNDSNGGKKRTGASPVMGGVHFISTFFMMAG